VPHIPDPRIHYQHKRQPKPEIPIDLCKSGEGPAVEWRAKALTIAETCGNY